MRLTKITTEEQTLTILISFLKSKLKRVVFVECPISELERRLRQLLSSKLQKVCYYRNKFGWHFYSDNCMMFFGYNIKIFDCQNVTDYINYCPDSIRRQDENLF